MEDAGRLRHFGDRLVEAIPGDAGDVLAVDQDAPFDAARIAGGSA